MIINRLENKTRFSRCQAKNATSNTMGNKSQCSSSLPNFAQTSIYRTNISFSSQKVINYLFKKLNSPDTSSAILFEFEKLKGREQSQFNKLFKEKTGFPSLKKVSEMIEEDAVHCIKKSADEVGVKILLSGYNDTCSVGKGVALPGSDIDTWFTVIDGNQEQSKEVLARLKNRVSPLLLSVTSSRTDDLPEVLTKKEFLNSVIEADRIFKENPEFQLSEKEYELILKNKQDDWVKAGKFNIDLAKKLENSSKTPMVRAALIMEILGRGKVFINSFDDTEKLLLKNSCLYKYSNSQQMQIYKHELKDKHLARIDYLKDFDKWPQEKQFDTIKNIIKLTFKDERNKIYIDSNNVSPQHTALYKSYACGNMDVLFKHLLSKEHGGI